MFLGCREGGGGVFLGCREEGGEGEAGVLRREECSSGVVKEAAKEEEECSLDVVEASLVSAISLLLLWACMVLFVSHSLEISCLLIFLQGSLIYFPFSMNFENLLLLVLFYSLYIYIFPF